MGSPTDVLAGRRAILFDLDGTFYCNQTYRAYVAEMDRITGLLVQDLYGSDTPEQAYAQLAEDRDRLGVVTRGEALEQRFGLSLAAMNRHRELHTRPEVHLKRDDRLIAALDRLGKSFRLLIGTNNTPIVARRVLAALGVDERLFALISSAEDVGRAKPAASFFQAILDRSGFSGPEVVSVGDRPEVDLWPAAALGMGTFVVQTVADVYALAGVAETRSGR